MNEQLNGIPADANERRFTGIWIPAEIWLDPNLTGLAKMLYAEIASFGDRGCWKKSDELREPLGISSDTFQRICRQLKDGGYITERRAFGRIVRKTTLGFYSSTENPHRPQNTADEQPQKPADEQPQIPGVHKEYSKNKERTHINDAEASPESEKSAEYGRQDINAMVERWSDEISDIKDDKNQRRQIYNLIRKYGEAGTIGLIYRIVAMQTTGDQYAPLILKPSDLTGKYSKLAKLEAWEQRQAEAPKLASAPSSWFQRPPEYEEISDEERAIVSQRFKEARKSLPFLNKEGKK